MDPSGDPLPTIDPDILIKAREALSLKGLYNQVALKQIRDLCRENSNIGLLYHCQAKILEDCSDNASEDKNKKKHLEDAISYERKSLELCPKSIKFSFFLAVLLYKSSTEVHGFKGAMQEFSKALKIQLPSDPFHETIRPDRKLAKFPTRQKRIENVRGKILNHIGICVIELKALRIGPKTITEIKAILQNLEATKKEKVCLYWNLLSLKEKRGLLRINVNDLKSHLKSTKSHTEKEVLLQALILYEGHAKWNFWECCLCKDTFFATPELLFLHVSQTHLKDRLPKMEEEYSVTLSEWIPLITSESWRPLLRPESSSNGEFEMPSDYVNPFKKTDSWHTPTDSTRKALLESIQKGLKELLKNNYLLGVHINMLTKRVVSKLDLGFDLLEDLASDKPHHSLCLLSASQLEDILKFLQEIFDLTMESFEEAGVKETTCDFRNNGIVSLTTDSSHLHLHEYSLRNKNVSVTSDLNSTNGAKGPPNVDDMLPWIYSGLLSGEDLTRWKRLRDERRLQGETDVLKYENRLLDGLETIQDLQQRLSVDGQNTDFALRKPHKRSKNNDLEVSESDKLVLQLALEVRHFKESVTHYGFNDYRPIVLSIVKSYIREKLEGIMDKDTAKKKSDAAAGVVSQQGMSECESSRDSFLSSDTRNNTEDVLQPRVT